MFTQNPGFTNGFPCGDNCEDTREILSKTRILNEIIAKTTFMNCIISSSQPTSGKCYLSVNQPNFQQNLSNNKKVP